jgi:hypothetical protein
MLLNLKNTTLLFVETRAHEITKRVIEDCISKADFGDILIFSDQPERIPVAGARYELVPDFPNKKLAGQFYYASAMSRVETDFALMLEWDAGIFDPSKWKPEFFNYDYVGAPWVVRPGDMHDVGNGGFTLMSKGLGHYAVENFKRFPVYTDWDFCRTQRKNFEAAGFKWPDRVLASHFAWELGPRNPDHFGYHGAFTWPVTLPKEEVIERARLMLKTEYLTVKARQLFKEAPWLESELTPEEVATFYNTVPPGYVLRPKIYGMMSPQQRAAMQLAQAQRRGLVTSKQLIGRPPQTGQKA